ncbi:MAG TPA: anthranilate synthase component I family protein [Nitrososphaeraceae archaeon]|nr:anthranilate synthase component I family protein [Nitrososphaeraceae archaeon]
MSTVDNDKIQVKLHKLNTNYNQFEIFQKFYRLFDKIFILESLVGPKELSEVSIIGFDPKITVTCNSKTFLVCNRNKIIEKVDTTEPLSQLRRIMPKINDDRFRYIGGAVGYVSYDAIRFWERLPDNIKKEKNEFPLLEFGIYTDGILFNHTENHAYYFHVTNDCRFDEIQTQIDRSSKKSHYRSFSYSTPKTNITKKKYMDLVNKSKEYLYNGDIFQVVLSKKMDFGITGDLLGVYRTLRQINPSPYMYLLKMSDKCILGSSPEMLLRITKDLVETFPIAGTRPIVNDENKNKELSISLLNDEKEIAEHTMLVDLARNDIGRVCRYGTVRVRDLMTVKRFSHVQHIVSHIVGRLQNGKDSFDAFKALFPAGTVSGAPKVRAMEIIDELEPNVRGPYAGALGYFSFNGSCDFAITIRSLFINNNRAYVQSGAGIVIDSIPEKEWDETEYKLNAIMSALKDQKKDKRYKK